jgi:hypothetical protein
MAVPRQLSCVNLMTLKKNKFLSNRIYLETFVKIIRTEIKKNMVAYFNVTDVSYRAGEGVK